MNQKIIYLRCTGTCEVEVGGSARDQDLGVGLGRFGLVGVDLVESALRAHGTLLQGRQAALDAKRLKEKANQ